MLNRLWSTGLIVASTVVFSAVFTTSSFAQLPGATAGGGMYAFAGGGLGNLHTEIENPSFSAKTSEEYNLAFMGGVGMQYQPQIRVEARGMYLSRQANDLVSGTNATLDLSSIALTGNAIYDVVNNQQYSLYVGGGAGTSFNQYDFKSDSSSFYRGSTGLAFGLFAGGSFNLAPNTAVFAEAGYNNFGTIELENTSSGLSKASYDAITAIAGVRIKF